VYFKTRSFANNKEKMIFKKTLELAGEAGLLNEEIDQVIDSTLMPGKGNPVSKLYLLQQR